MTELDQLLLKAYNRGAILCGVSAGAICWFEKGVTDSWASNLTIMDCMGFVQGCCCPHYDGERDRKPSVENFLKDSIINSCYALEVGSAIHYKYGEIYTAVSFFKEAKAYKVTLNNNSINHEVIKGLSLV